MTTESSIIGEFKVAAAADPAQAKAALVERLAAARGPLVEEAGSGRYLVTFVWIGAAESVSIRGTQLFPDLMAPSHPMERVPGTDIWYRSVLAPANVINTYQFVIDDPARAADTTDLAELTRLHAESTRRGYADPFNPMRLYPLTALVLGITDLPSAQWDSIVTTPGAAVSPLFEPVASPEERVVDRQLKSSVFGDERTISVYRPAGYRPTGRPHPLILLFDGEAWLMSARLDVALDNLSGAAQIDPPVVAFVHNVDGPQRVASRMRDLSCNPAFNRMLIDELLPMLRAEFNVATDPGQVIVGGASLGGLAAAYAAFEHPDVFGNVLSSSGTHWWGYADPASPSPWGKDDEPEWLTRQYAAAPLKPVRVWIDVGGLETGTLLPMSPGVDHRAASRHFRTVLKAKGNEVAYFEPMGGHEFATFRESFVRAAQWFLGRSAPAQPNPETDR